MSGRPPLLLLLALLVVPLAAPALGQPAPSAGADAGAALRSVGTFEVRPSAQSPGAGHAEGAVVASTVADAEAAEGGSVLRDVAVRSQTGERTIFFSAVEIPGFRPVSRLEGVGTSALTLRGAGAVVSLTDTVGSALVVEAAGDAEQPVVLHLAPGVEAAAGGSASVFEIRAEGSRGTLLLASARGAAIGTLGIVATDRVGATLAPGERLVFRTDTRPPGGAAAEVAAYNRAVVVALAEGILAGEATTEFTSEGTLLADARVAGEAAARTATLAPRRVVSHLRAEGASQGGLVLAYDLDYVDLPARTAADVAAYVDGRLAARVESAAEVVTGARVGEPRYWTMATDGRVLALVSTASRAQATLVTLATLAGGAAPSALAELDARLGLSARVSGTFDARSTSEGAPVVEVLGDFARFLVVSSGAEIRQHALVRASTPVFASLRFAAGSASEATAQVQPAAEGAVEVAARAGERLVANARMVDDVHASIVTQAHVATRVEHTLAAHLAATRLEHGLVRVDGPEGAVGFLVLVGGEAGGRLEVPRVDHVRAELDAGARLVWHAAGETSAAAGAEAAARAAAAGRLASRTTVALVEGVLDSADLAYRADAWLRFARDASRRGELALDVVGRAEADVVVLLQADRASLPAAGPADVAVRVGEEAAFRVASFAELLALVETGRLARASYAVDAGLDGVSRVAVALPRALATEGVRVVAESRVEAESRARAALDVFGTFEPGYGGAAAGTIASFVARPEAAMILDYTVAAKASAAQAQRTRVFDAVRVGSSAFATGSASASHALRFTSREAVVEAYDVSGAILRVAATADTGATFRLGQGVEAEAVGPRVVMLRAPDFAGVLVLADVEAGAGAAAGSALRVSEGAKPAVEAVLRHGAQVVFKAFSGFEAELEASARLAQAEAIAAGRLVGHVIVRTDASAGATSAAVVDLAGDASAVVSVATREKVEILVGAAGSAGRAVVVSLDRATVSGLIRGEARLRVDGEEVPQAASYAEALEAKADRHWIITTGGEVGLQAIVGLGHFSTRTVTIESPGPPSPYLWSTIGLAFLVLAQLAYPRFRRAKP